jgi:glyoxylase-like metal-dependent hydrolase (beta-lactamase superfamily II)
MTTRHSPSTGRGSPDVWGLYEPDTGSVQYVCACPRTRKAALIDVVLNFDPTSASTSTRSADAVLELAARERLEVAWVLDTHPHADHMMASARLKERTGAPTAIGEKVAEIAELWRGLYHMPGAFDVRADFDRLLAEGDRLAIGELEAEVWLSPGHTLGSVSFIVGDAAFVHDTLMYPDSGSSRADFPGACVHQLWESLQRILALPAETRLFVGHDYCKDGRDPAWEATVAEHRAGNVHLKDGTSKDEFVRIRTERDRKLDIPKRMLASLQVNLRGGRLPEPESDGASYLKIPLNKFR